MRYLISVKRVITWFYRQQFRRYILNLLTVTMKKMGIECTIVDPDADEEILNQAFQENTKCVLAESIANPALVVLDFEKLQRLHMHMVFH